MILGWWEPSPDRHSHAPIQTVSRIILSRATGLAQPNLHIDSLAGGCSVLLAFCDQSYPAAVILGSLDPTER